MGKLHEVLAVEVDLKATAEKLLKEALHTLKDKATHFEASEVRFHPDEETTLVEAPEVKPMVDTLRSKIKFVTEPYAKYIDAVFQKESTNQLAKADIELNDEEGEKILLAKDVPATVLLGLESRLKEIRALYESAPTLAPGENWAKDEKSGNFKAVSERIRTAKITEPLVVVPPTKEHPAQVATVSKDVRKGRVVTTKESSFFTPAEKSDLIGRVDVLIRAVKKARMRANNQEVVGGKIGKKIFDYIHKGVV
jgi:hypothetical protein